MREHNCTILTLWLPGCVLDARSIECSDPGRENTSYTRIANYLGRHLTHASVATNAIACSEDQPDNGNALREHLCHNAGWILSLFSASLPPEHPLLSALGQRSVHIVDRAGCLRTFHQRGRRRQDDAEDVGGKSCVNSRKRCFYWALPGCPSVSCASRVPPHGKTIAGR